MKVGAARLEDRLGPHEPPYKSRGEAQVGRLLDRYGIPFFYERPLVVYDRRKYRVWHPDFLLPGYNRLVVEYAGMPDVPKYMEGILHKENVYKANRIPVLFVYPRHLKEPEWPKRLVKRIRQFGGAYTGKQPASGYRAARRRSGYR